AQGVNPVNPAPRILLVGRDLDEREMYAQWLQYLGATTIQASSVHDALRAAVELHPDIVVTGVGLAGRTSGLALTRYLKRPSVAHHLPVIVLTADISPEVSRLARQAGCDRFLTKP